MNDPYEETKKMMADANRAVEESGRALNRVILYGAIACFLCAGSVIACVVYFLHKVLAK